MSLTAGKLPTSKIAYDTVLLRGGFDQLTPSLSLGPGVCRLASNYEVSPTGGYSRVGGYERFSGKTQPSSATYTLVQVASFTNTPSVGQTLTGATSGATGQIIVVGANYLALTLVTGSFTDSEVVQVGATTIGTAVPRTVTISTRVNAQYLAAAADAYRALIAVVPGSGPVRGVVSAIIGGSNEVYAFRDNAGATACVLHRATTSGWTAVTLYREIYFTAGGTTIPSDGATLSRGGNSAVIQRVVLESGSWASGTAAGRFIIATPTPGEFTAGAATIGAINVTLSGASTAITLLPGGTYVFDQGNFSGQLATRRIYGADGVNRAFEFDGTVFVPIETKADVDTPLHIRIHHYHLFVSLGSSILHSAQGLPYDFSASGGANEIATGDTVTAMLVQPGSQDNATMAVFTRNGSGMLYGTSSATFKLVAYTAATGAIAYMAQNLDKSYVLDDRGVLSIEAAQTYGNFLQAALTQHIQTFISDKRSLAVCSTTNKDKSQYRAYFTDGSALYVTIAGGKFLGAMPMQFEHPFRCVWNGELTGGEEVTYAGGTDGYVYQLDKGSSFDGEDIDASITLNWNALKSPRLKKRFRRASIELQGNYYAHINFGYELGYSSTEISQTAAKEYVTNFEGLAFWDTAIWDAFMWDGGTAVPTEVTMDGRGENVQLTFASGSDYIYPYTLNSVTIHYSYGRALR